MHPLWASPPHSVSLCPRGERADKVTVIVRRGAEEYRTALSLVRFEGDATVYEGELRLPVAGLWYYRFESSLAGRVTYYGRGSGGCAVSGEWLPEWQLTVTKRAYKTTDWAKEGVVYQIFADRFARAGEVRFAKKGTLHADGTTSPTSRRRERSTARTISSAATPRAS